MNRKTQARALALSCVLVFGLAACSQRADDPVAAAPATDPAQPVASVLDLMKHQIDPAADFLWESVATVSTLEGTVERQPRTDEEWLAVRVQALQLAEAANLLMTPGRRVAHEGQTLDDADAPGNLTAAQAQAGIDANRATYLAYAAALRDTAVLTLQAIERRDLPAYFDLGARIDEACEQCHVRFWYPDSPPPPTAMR